MALNFVLGETFLIDVLCTDGNGLPLSLTGGSVAFVIDNPATLTASTATTGVTFVSAAVGTALVQITPGMQAAAGLTRGVYPYELRATTAGGVVSVQDQDTLLILPSTVAI
jgi:hypothetical protein